MTPLPNSKHRILLAAGGVLLGTVLALAPPLPAQMPPSPVKVDPVRQEKVQQKRRVTGELRPVRRSRVAAEEPGLVEELPVEEGQTVRKGDLLARLHSDRLQLELSEQRAARKVAEATRDEAVADRDQKLRDLETLKKLDEKGASNPKELADAATAHLAAEARLLRAQHQISVIDAQSSLLDQRVRDTEIRAPFDGSIVKVSRELGEWVAEGDSLVDLISVGPIEAWLSVPESNLAASRAPGYQVRITIPALQRELTSSDTRSVPLVDSTSRNFALIAVLDNEDGLLTPGMAIGALVPTDEEREELTVRKDAVLRNEVGSYIYVARGQSADGPFVASPVPVQVLYGQGDRLVVRGAVRADDLAIVEGNERLFPGAPVIPMGTEPQPGGGRQP